MVAPPFLHEPCLNIKNDEKVYVGHPDDFHIKRDDTGKIIEVTAKRVGLYRGKYFHRPVLVLNEGEVATEAQLKSLEDYRVNDTPPTVQARKFKFKLKNA